MSPERLKASLAISDFTDPINGVHAINIVASNIRQALEKAYAGMIIEEIRSNPEVSVKENFDDLLFPTDNAGRSSRYTRYVSEDTIL